MKRKKIKVAVVITIISIIIAVISLSFSFYMGIRDVSYKEVQKRNLEFDEIYGKILLVEKNIANQLDNCNKTNKEMLSHNLNLLMNSRVAVIKNDYLGASDYLNDINTDQICSEEISFWDYSFYWTIGILVITWSILIIAFFRIIRTRKK